MKTWVEMRVLAVASGRLVALAFFTLFEVQASAADDNDPTASPASEVEEARMKDLAMDLANPIADLVSIPLQLNGDYKLGPTEDGEQYKLNIQPVIPFGLNTTWNVISRTILPLIDQNDVVDDDRQTGTGDILQSFFFSPKARTSTGWIWGAGPVFSFPTASDSVLGTEKWGLGPTAVALKQWGGWTLGGLANHVWSLGGHKDRKDVNATFLQPFLGYTTTKSTTFTINSESSYDWFSEDWTAPLNLMVAQLVKIGSQLVQFQVGYRTYMEAPDNGPEYGWRLNVTFLFPR